MEKQIVSVEWLKDNLNRSDLVILDASPSQTVNNDISAFDKLSIPTARRFRIKEHFTNKESEYPNTAPSSTQFQEESKKLGINKDSEIIVYDNLGIYTSPRAWWLFKLMGHNNIRVLNGGLPEWVHKGYETVESSTINREYPIGDFESTLNDELVISYNAICQNIASGEFLVVDARSNGRFEGTQAEPRKNLKSGNIPQSVNIPYQSVLENGKFKTESQLKEIFSDKTTNQDQLVFTCGSGLTACIVMLASTMSFQESYLLFDGSWTEYATKKGLVKRH